MTEAIEFSKKQIETIQHNYSDVTFEMNEGTPRSGKTTADIYKMANFYINSRDNNHIVTAYNQEQAFRMFFDGDGLGLAHIFSGCSTMKHDDHGDHLLLYLPNNVEKKIYYKGGGKSNSVGAIRGLSFGSVTFLEYDLINKEFIQEAFRRTMAAKDRFHLAEQNPPSPNHPNLEILQRFEKAGTFKFRHWTPNDNPILTKKRKAELRSELEGSQYLLDRDWFGKRVMPQGVIYSMYSNDKHLTNQIKGKVIETYFTADAGQSDATTCAFWAVTFDKGKYRLYRLANYYHSGKDTGNTKAMSIYAKEIKKFIEWCYERFEGINKWNYFFVDPAAKSLREELHLLHVATDKADNNSRDKGAGAGSRIEVGIERVQNLLEKEILLLYDNGSKYDHYNLIKEFGMYVRLDNGNPIDKYNHACDELRYSCNYFFKSYIA